MRIQGRIHFKAKSNQASESMSIAIRRINLQGTNWFANKHHAIRIHNRKYISKPVRNQSRESMSTLSAGLPPNSNKNTLLYGITLKKNKFNFKREKGQKRYKYDFYLKYNKNIKIHFYTDKSQKRTNPWV